MKSRILFLCFLTFSITAINGQDGPKDLSTLPLVSQPVPAGELLRRMPDSAQWVLTSLLLSDAAAPNKPNQPPPKPATVTVSKSGKFYKIESITPEGKVLVRWRDGQYQATYVAGIERPVIQYAPVYLYDGSVLYYLDFSKSDFPECLWISARNYAGMTKVGEVLALVFKTSVPIKTPEMQLLCDAHPSPSDAIAVIDPNTRRPIMLQVGNEILHYQFNATGPDVTIPPDAEAAFNSFRKQIKRASLPPPG